MTTSWKRGDEVGVTNYVKYRLETVNDRRLTGGMGIKNGKN